MDKPCQENQRRWNFVAANFSIKDLLVSFSEGLRSQDPRSPSYAPSIFPTGHVKPKGDEDVQRYRRAQKRSLNASIQASLTAFPR